MKPLLALIDLQNAYLAARELEPAAGSIVERAGHLLHFCRQHEVPVVHMRTVAGEEATGEAPPGRLFRRPRP